MAVGLGTTSAAAGSVPVSRSRPRGTRRAPPTARRRGRWRGCRRSRRARTGPASSTRCRCTGPAGGRRGRTRRPRFRQNRGVVAPPAGQPDGIPAHRSADDLGGRRRDLVAPRGGGDQVGALRGEWVVGVRGGGGPPARGHAGSLRAGVGWRRRGRRLAAALGARRRRRRRGGAVVVVVVGGAVIVVVGGASSCSSSGRGLVVDGVLVVVTSSSPMPARLGNCWTSMPSVATFMKSSHIDSGRLVPPTR